MLILRDLSNHGFLQLPFSLISVNCEFLLLYLRKIVECLLRAWQATQAKDLSLPDIGLVILKVGSSIYGWKHYIWSWNGEVLKSRKVWSPYRQGREIYSSLFQEYYCEMNTNFVSAGIGIQVADSIFRSFNYWSNCTRLKDRVSEKPKGEHSSARGRYTTKCSP